MWSWIHTQVKRRHPILTEIRTVSKLKCLLLKLMSLQISLLFFRIQLSVLWMNNKMMLLPRIVEGFTWENVEASWTKSLWMLSPPCSPKNPRGKHHLLKNGTTCSSGICIFGGKVASGKLLLKKVTNASMSCSVDKVKKVRKYVRERKRKYKHNSYA